jgi:phage tail-like protein
MIGVGGSASISGGVSGGIGAGGSGGGGGGRDGEAKRPEWAPFQVFRFHVEFSTVSLQGAATDGSAKNLCGGAFSECTGLEATMEPKVIKEGGRNYGAAQRMGQVSFATVVLKRGMTKNRDLWKWFWLVGQGAYAFRLNARIRMEDEAGNEVLVWQLERAMPVKFKAADLNAKGSDVGIEELHIAHEGLRLLRPA